jgi:CO dehydrogenase maturation factor
MSRPCRIAVSGKGGTGKTTLSALLIVSLIQEGIGPVLAVDADPNANLHEALGVSVQETLGSMREEAFTRSIPPGMSRKSYIQYRFRRALIEAEGFDLVAMGRPEGTGCYCFANNLLSEAMEGLEKEYRVMVIDTEAGMEHISRGTVGEPDLLLIVSDPSARGVRTAERIQSLAIGIGMKRERMRLVFNRYRPEFGRAAEESIPVAGIIPEDPAVEKADIAGLPLVQIPPESPARLAVRTLTEELIRICAQQGSPP